MDLSVWGAIGERQPCVFRVPDTLHASVGKRCRMSEVLLHNHCRRIVACGSRERGKSVRAEVQKTARIARIALIVTGGYGLG